MSHLQNLYSYRQHFAGICEFSSYGTGGAGTNYLPYAPAGVGTSPLGGAGCRLCESAESADFGPLGALRTFEMFKECLRSGQACFKMFKGHV